MTSNSVLPYTFIPLHRMASTDLTLVCADCGLDFEFSSGEQAFFEKNDFPQPKRCKACRLAKKQRHEKRRNSNSQQ